MVLLIPSTSRQMIGIDTNMHGSGKLRGTARVVNEK